MFLSGVKDHENFSLLCLKRYVYTKIDYFPAYLITKHLRNIKIWYRVKFIRQHDEETDDDDDTDNDNDSGDDDNDNHDLEQVPRDIKPIRIHRCRRRRHRLDLH